MKRFILSVLLLILAGCTALPTGKYGSAEKEIPASRRLVIWMLSDIQPVSPDRHFVFERAIEDVNTHVGQVDMAVVAGDLLKSRSREEEFEWFIATRNRSKVKSWFEIAGNHDVRSLDNFRRYFPRPAYYAVSVGNILLLLLSDESPASETEVSDAAFVWWRDMVMRNRDRIIITVTHAQLRHSGLVGSFVSSRRIKDDHRFEEVLRKERVSLWASGHSHLPHAWSGTVSIQRDLGGTCFVNVSSICEGTMLDSQSRFLEFEEGSNVLWLRSRNHTQGRFENSLDIPLQLHTPFVWDGAAAEVIEPSGPGG